MGRGPDVTFNLLVHLELLSINQDEIKLLLGYDKNAESVKHNFS